MASSISKLCNDLETSDSPQSIFQTISLKIRNTFFYAAICIPKNSPKYPLAEKITSSLSCVGIPIGLQIVSWNVDSLRAGIVDSLTAACKNKDRHILPSSPMGQLLSEYDPDIICLQETKISPGHVSCFSPAGYHTSWSSSTQRKGYSGVSVWSKEKPIKVDTFLPGISDELQNEGRILTVYFSGYIIVNTYVPNTLRGGLRPLGGWKSVKDDKKRDEREAAYDYYVGGRLEWDIAIKNHLNFLKTVSPNVIWCGDLNVARSLLDIHNGQMTEMKLNKAVGSKEPEKRIKDLKSRLKDAKNADIHGGQAGYRLEEREGLENILKDDFIDAYRELYPNDYGFTFYDRTKHGYRQAGNGWRLDYFVVSKHLELCVRDVKVLKDLGVVGNKVPSDHVPILIQF